jgi:hypothetical protein
MLYFHDEYGIAMDTWSFPPDMTMHVKTFIVINTLAKDKVTSLTIMVLQSTK